MLTHSEHLNIYGADGKFEKQVAYTKGTSLVNAILNAAEGLAAEQRGQVNWDRVNQVMVKSGLDWKEGEGWYAKTEDAKKERETAIAERNAQAAAGIQKPGFVQQVTGFFSDIFSSNGILKGVQATAKTMVDTVLGWFQEPKEEKEERNPPIATPP